MAVLIVWVKVLDVNVWLRYSSFLLVDLKYFLAVESLLPLAVLDNVLKISSPELFFLFLKHVVLKNPQRSSVVQAKKSMRHPPPPLNFLLIEIMSLMHSNKWLEEYPEL